MLSAMESCQHIFVFMLFSVCHQESFLIDILDANVFVWSHTNRSLLKRCSCLAVVCTASLSSESCGREGFALYRGLFFLFCLIFGALIFSISFAFLEFSG